MAKITLRATTYREFATEDELNSFILDLENSRLFEIAIINSLRSQQNSFTNKKELGYNGKEETVTTYFEFL